MVLCMTWADSSTKPFTCERQISLDSRQNVTVHLILNFRGDTIDFQICNSTEFSTKGASLRREAAFNSTNPPSNDVF
jgi:hypothetical protein